MKTKTINMHFRVDTLALLNEIIECSLPRNSGVLKIPLNTFKNLLAATAQRATQLNDPILNQCMFDLTLYELPQPHTKEYSKLMSRIYAEAEKQRRKERKEKSKINLSNQN